MKLALHLPTPTTDEFKNEVIDEVNKIMFENDIPNKVLGVKLLAIVEFENSISVPNQNKLINVVIKDGNAKNPLDNQMNAKDFKFTSIEELTNY